MKLKLGTVTLFLVASLSAHAQGQITVQDAWSRATPPGAKIAGGYLVIRNAGAADRLVSASSPAAERVETHVTIRDGDISRMREVKGYDAEAGRLASHAREYQGAVQGRHDRAADPQVRKGG